MVTSIILVAAGLIAGGVAALAVIAPKTKNTTDDAVLAFLARIEPILKGLANDASKK